MITTRETIQKFFRYLKNSGYHAFDLLDRYTPGMEIQINVARDDGELVQGESGSYYTDGMYNWWMIRIPKDAKGTPHWKDYTQTWPISKHAEAIGMTGWDWEEKKSRWVGFDVDSIVGHASGVGISDEELNEVKERAYDIPWAEVRKSTSGNGVHLYVYLDSIPTENHTEHAALGKAVLDMMSDLSGFNFSLAVDVCGSNMWVWHRKVTTKNQGLLILKAAKSVLTEADLPINWRDNVDVVNKNRSLVRIRGVKPDENNEIKDLSNAKITVPLDKRHHQVIDALCESGFTTIWIHDYNLLQTHTVALKNLLETQRTHLDLKGFFETLSPGDDPEKPNVYMFPMEDGGWKVYRFNESTEHSMWTSEGDGPTFCYFNRDPTLYSACNAFGGMEEETSNSFRFQTVVGARQAADALGTTIDLGRIWDNRQARLKLGKNEKLIIQVKKLPTDEPPQGWVDSKEWWTKVSQSRPTSQEDTGKWTEYEPFIRCVSTSSNVEADWVLRQRVDSDTWVRRPPVSIMRWLNHRGHTDIEAKQILGQAVETSWTEVHLPFQDEYPGDRTWNRHAPQLSYTPTEFLDGQNPSMDHWWKILNHLGSNLDEAVRTHPWGLENGVTTGGQYLAHWIASLIRFPFDNLPYLFFWGNQDCGKSIFHEALDILFTCGVVDADRALTNSGEFNGELANAIIGVIEEKDIAKTGIAVINKVKSIVTGRTISIRAMGRDTYRQRNTVKLLQFSNDRWACLVEPGDTRITSIHVPNLDPGSIIPKIGPNGLLSSLKKEAPDFLGFLMALTLSDPYDRLRVAMICTEDKKQIEHMAKSSLQRFIEENLVEVSGHAVLFSEFFSRFQEWMPEEDRREWGSRMKISKQLKSSMVLGKYGSSNHTHIGNIFWIKEPVEPLLFLTLKNGRLTREEDE